MNNITSPSQNNKPYPSTSDTPEKITKPENTSIKIDATISVKSSKKKKKVSRNAIVASNSSYPTIHPIFDSMKSNINKISLVSFDLENSTNSTILKISGQLHTGKHFTLIQNVIHYCYMKCEELIKLEEESIHFEQIAAWVHELKELLVFAGADSYILRIAEDLKNGQNKSIITHLSNEPLLKSPADSLESIENKLEGILAAINGKNFKDAYLFKFRNFRTSQEYRLKPLREKWGGISDEIETAISALYDILQLPSSQFKMLSFAHACDFKEWKQFTPLNENEILKELKSIKSMIIKSYINYDVQIINWTSYEKQLKHLLEPLESKFTEKQVQTFFSEALKNRAIAKVLSQQALKLYEEQAAKEPLISTSSIKKSDIVCPDSVKILCKEKNITIIQISDSNQISITPASSRFNLGEPFQSFANYCICTMHHDYLLPMEDIAMEHFSKSFTFDHSTQALGQIIDSLQGVKTLVEDDLLKVISLLGNTLKEKLSSVKALENTFFHVIDDYVEVTCRFASRFHECLDKRTLSHLEEFVAEIQKINTTSTTWFVFKENLLNRLGGITSGFTLEIKKLNNAIDKELSINPFFLSELEEAKKAIEEFKNEIVPFLTPLFNLSLGIEQLVTPSPIKKSQSVPKKKIEKGIPEFCDFNFKSLYKTALPTQEKKTIEEKIKIVPTIQEEKLPESIDEEITTVEEWIDFDELEMDYSDFHFSVDSSKEVEEKETSTEDQKEKVDLPNRHYKGVVNLLKEDGWVPKKYSSSHLIFEKENYSLPVPIHKNKPDLKPGTFKNILKLKAEKEEQILNNK